MPVTTERQETQFVIRIEGECSVGSASDLKAALIESLGSDLPVEVDLTGVDELGICGVQLLWAAEQEAAQRNRALISHASESIASEAREAGFDHFPGTARETGGV